MSQRGSEQAPFPADGGRGRRGGANGRALEHELAHGPRGSRYREPRSTWDDETLDPHELDRYLEDRARLAGSSRTTRHEGGPEERAAGSSGSRWSSPGRRRRPGQASSRPAFDDDPEGPLPPAPAEPPRARGERSAAYQPYAESLGGLPGEGDEPYLYEDVDVDPGYVAPRRTRRRARRAARPRPRVVMPQVRLPASLAEADLVRDPVALGLLGGSVLLAVVAALVTLSRVGDLPGTIELRYDAFGAPTRWGPPRSLWQLPLLAAMVTLINLVLAAAVSRGDRFASRFLLAAAFVVGLLAWVPLARFLW